MTDLSDEMKEQIKKEFDVLVNDNEKVLNEFKLYYGLARRIWLFVVGGSIAGLLGAKSYIDDRISDRANQFDNLYVANNLSESDPASAYDLFIKFKGANLIEDKRWDLSGLSNSQKTYFFFTALKILANVPTQDNKDSRHYVGKTRWQALLADDDFKALPSSTQNSYDFNLRMGISKLRYAETREDIETSIPNLEAALNSSNSSMEKAAVAWYFGMAKLVLGHKDAISNLSMIFNDSYPQYSSMYYANYVKSSKINDVIKKPDLNLISNVWKRLYTVEFDERIKKAIIEAQLLSHISYFIELDSPDKINKALQDANKIRHDFIEYAKSNNRSLINKLLYNDSFGYGFRNTIHFSSKYIIPEYDSKDHQNAGRIVDVFRGADNNLVINIDYCDENESCIWQFSQSKMAPGEWKILYFPELNSFFDSPKNASMHPSLISKQHITKKKKIFRNKN